MNPSIIIDHAVRVVDLVTQDQSGLIACALPSPRLMWRLEATRGDVAIRGYEVERCPFGRFDPPSATSGRCDMPGAVCADWPGAPLQSREVAWCRVRVWTDVGATAWSAPLRVEGALFAADDWLAVPISPQSNIARREPAPVPYLRKPFHVAKPIRSARLYATALGIFDCWINGAKVGDALLEPGWSTHPKRHLYVSHDVTDLLAQGENVVAAAVGDGWWRGNLTWIPKRAVYGDTTAFMAQLEVTYADGEIERIATDGTWRGGSGQLRMADIYDGCEIDYAQEPGGWMLPGYDDSGWEAVAVLDRPGKLEQRSIPPVRVLETRPVAMRPLPETGAIRVDCGQNLTGFLKLTVDARGPATIIVRHAEMLDRDDNLHVAALRTAKATDRYVVAPGRHALAPSFTYHGFRYADIRIEGDAALESVVCEVVASDLHPAGRFACSHESVNRLWDAIWWSQRGNFVALPTDCPQRDERLGWTGDIQVFAPTACANFDSRAFLASWLVDLALDQRADGNVTSVVPNVIQGHDYEYGGIGWADAATLVPWALYEAYGDTATLARQFDSMRKWVDYGLSRLDASGTWRGDFHLGDWLDPGAPPDRPEQATTDRDFIASAYLALSARVLGQAAAILDLPALAERYAERSRAVAEATWEVWRAVIPATQTGCAMAIMFEIAPEADRARLGRCLAELVEAGEGRIATGFLGTPLVLPALTATGQIDAAYQVLLNERCPGWLYQITQGATTMWERWDAVGPDGQIASGAMAMEDSDSMISFNHYAYGSVGAWLYRSLAGIAPAEPGYRAIRFAPCPGGGITWAAATVATPYGKASIDWRIEGTALAVKLAVPPGASAEFLCPLGWQGAPRRLGSGEHAFTLPAH